MVEALKLYRKILKSPLLLKSHYEFLFIIMLNLILTPWLGSDIEILIYVFFSISILQDLNERKYMLLKILPVNLKHRVVLLYLSNFALNGIGVITSSLGYYYARKHRSIIVSIMIVLISVSLSSIIYMYICNEGFRIKTINEMGKRPPIYIAIIIAFLAIGIRATGIEEGIVSYKLHQISFVQQGGILVILLVACIISVYISSKQLLQGTTKTR